MLVPFCFVTPRYLQCFDRSLVGIIYLVRYDFVASGLGKIHDIDVLSLISQVSVHKYRASKSCKRVVSFNVSYSAIVV